MIRNRNLQVANVAGRLEDVRQIGRHVQHVLDVVALERPGIGRMGGVAEEEAGLDLDGCLGHRRMGVALAVGRLGGTAARRVGLWCGNAEGSVWLEEMREFVRLCYKCHPDTFGRETYRSPISCSVGPVPVVDDLELALELSSSHHSGKASRKLVKPSVRKYN